jgi:hypothetical protein
MTGDAAKDRLRMERGSVPVPNQPGLGTNLADAALTKPFITVFCGVSVGFSR